MSETEYNIHCSIYCFIRLRSCELRRASRAGHRGDPEPRVLGELPRASRRVRFRTAETAELQRSPSLWMLNTMIIKYACSTHDLLHQSREQVVVVAASVSKNLFLGKATAECPPGEFPHMTF